MNSAAFTAPVKDGSMCRAQRKVAHGGSVMAGSRSRACKSRYLRMPGGLTCHGAGWAACLHAEWGQTSSELQGNRAEK